MKEKRFKTAAVNAGSFRAAACAAVIAVLFAPVAVLAAGCSAGPGAGNLVIINNTLSDILSMHISPTGVDDWEEDVLADGMLGSGKSLSVSFNGRSERLWDVKIVYSGDRPDAEFTGIDIASVKTLMMIDGIFGGTMFIPMTDNPAPAVRQAAAPILRPAANPAIPAPTMPFIPSPTPSFDAGGGNAQPYRLCPGCHGTGNCPVCHGVGSTSSYGISVPCDVKCRSCGGLGRY